MFVFAKAPVHRSVALALGTFALIACGSDATSDQSESDPTAGAIASAASSTPNVVNVSAGDFFYTMADTIPAGATTFELSINGNEMHHMQLVRVPDDKSLEDLLPSIHGGPPPAWAEFAGGPNSPTPMSGASRVTLDLQPGKYFVLCMIPSADGAMHVSKGMSKTLVVVPSDNAAAMPEATSTMTLTDYDFVLSAPLKAGANVLKVVNSVTQPHEVFIARLAPGANAQKLLEWIGKPDGPPPGEAIGGTVGINMGMSNLVHLDLTPGEYALVCFLPDMGDGKPHFMHGMIKQITVM